MDNINNTCMVDAYMPFVDMDTAASSAASLMASGVVGRTVFIGVKDGGGSAAETITAPSFDSSECMRKIAADAVSPYVLLYAAGSPLAMSAGAIERMVAEAKAADAAVVYSAHYRIRELDGTTETVPVIERQYGSLRDDFDYGPLMLVDTTKMREAMTDAGYLYAGRYDMLLRLSRVSQFVRVTDCLYTYGYADGRPSGKKMFDYVDPSNRDRQIEMEQACTDHLKAIGGWLAPGDYDHVDLDAGDFPVEATVIIPVRNRVGTIADAIESAMSQKTDFSYNIIVVDNHSTDGTSDIVAGYAANSDKVIHIIPDCEGLGIGGCWNLAAADDRCGRFALQLDSDDLYSDTDTIQRGVKEFRRRRCAM
ncbi:MAG: glycosyltransferase family 2 protein, partial [Muribaculaceae bacterium]|nr:glycosyltransferase family 2 protein [Muribaculaceae bacterium]